MYSNTKFIAVDRDRQTSKAAYNIVFGERYNAFPIAVGSASTYVEAVNNLLSQVELPEEAVLDLRSKEHDHGHYYFFK